jgi:holo-[acyl-carrier protein] synthase
MVFGIGTDILQMIRITRGIQAVGGTYLDRVYTKKEQEESCSHSDSNIYFASRYSAKEAVYKALRLTCSDMDWREIEILTDASGIPYVTLDGSSKLYAQEQHIHKIHLSISYETDYAVSYALAEM